MPIARSACGRRRGNTWIQVVVVLSILLVLAVVMLPQLASVSDGGRRQNTCRNNLRTLATATFNYQLRQGHYPGYMNALPTERGTPFVDPTLPGSTAPLPVSWTVMILSDIDRAQLLDNWMRTPPMPAVATTAGTRTIDYRTKFFTDQYIELLICPNDLPPSRTGTPISYVVNTGLPDGPASAAPRDRAAHGIFFDHFTEHPLVRPDETKRRPMVVIRYDSLVDPVDKTILVTENVDATSYVFRAATHAADDWRAAEVEAGCIWRPGAISGTGKLPTMTPPVSSPAPNVDAGRGSGASFDYCRPSSKHPGMVNVAMVGQNVMPLRDTISYYVFAKLMASDDANVDTGDPAADAALKGYALTDADLSP